MPVTDLIGNIILGINLALQVTQVVLIDWIVFHGGWLYLGRVIGFRIDLKIAEYIGMFYEYFNKFLTQELFNKDVLNELLKNVYVFIGLIMVFRLMMILLKYLVNPDLTSDAKLGVNNLIRRVVIGLVGILFIPMIMDVSLDLQSAILQDSLIQKIIIPKEYLPKVEKIQQSGGKYIATYVLAGFVNPTQNAPEKVKRAYETGINNGDLSPIKKYMNDKKYSMENQYVLNYAPIVSTLVMAYVLMQMAKFCLDIITRCFRLLIYKILTPVAMIEYMIKGADDGVFKTWKQAIISTYVSIFIRVMALWFVVFVTALMQEDPAHKYVKDSLLASDDSMVRAFIIVALLGFMMDLPKLMGSIFGLDFEQSGNADGIFKSITGMVKTGITGGLGAIGAGIGAIGGTAVLGAKQLGAMHDLHQKNPNLTGNALWQAANKKTGFMQGVAGQRSGLTGAIAGLTPYSKSLYGGASGVYAAGMKDASSEKSKNKEADKEAAQEARESERLARERRQEGREIFRDLRHDMERGSDIGRWMTTNPDGTERPMTRDEIRDSIMQSYESPSVNDGGVMAPQLQVDLRNALQGMINNGETKLDTTGLATAIQNSLSSSNINITNDQANQIAQQTMRDSGATITNGTIDLNAGSAAALTATVNASYTTSLSSIVDQELGKTMDMGLITTPGSEGRVHGVNNEPLDVMHQQLEVQQDIRYTTGQIQSDTHTTAGLVGGIAADTHHISQTQDVLVDQTQNIEYNTRANLNVNRNMASMVSDIAADTQHISQTQDVIVDTTEQIQQGQQRTEGQIRGIRRDTRAIRGDVEHIDQQLETVVDTTERIEQGQARVEGQLGDIRTDVGAIRGDTQHISQTQDTIVDTTGRIEQGQQRTEGQIRGIKRDTKKANDTLDDIDSKL